jgi:hypothetical protein
MKKDEILEDKRIKENYIKGFGEIFEIKNINIDTTKMPLLKYIVREFGEELYNPSDENRRLNRKTLTEEQTRKFMKYWELENKATGELAEQLFMYGFIMAKELENEGNSLKCKKLLK